MLPERWQWGPDIVQTLAPALAKLATTSTFLVTAPFLAAFVADECEKTVGGAAFSWALKAAPYRTLDRLFVLIRDPEEIVLAEVNAWLAAMRAEGGTGRHRPDDLDQWRALGEAHLAGEGLRDPICAALGSGDAARARTECRRTDIEIADHKRYGEWVRSAWDIEAEALPEDEAPSILSRDGLSPAGKAALAAATEQDRRFYDWVRDAVSRQRETEIAVRGGAL